MLQRKATLTEDASGNIVISDDGVKLKEIKSYYDDIEVEETDDIIRVTYGPSTKVEREEEGT